MPKLQFDEREIRREISAKVPGIYELRIICTDFYNTKLSAYFHSVCPDAVITQMMGWNYPANCCVNFFLTSNPVREYCEAREQFGNIRKTRVMSMDEDIARLTWLPIDIDSPHPTGVSANDAEKQEAHRVAVQVLEHMRSMGWEDAPEIVDSGNGYHIKYRIDFPNDDEGRGILAAVVDELHEQFGLIDTAVKNPARILKLPGTMAMKGRSTEDRPHRMARIISDAEGVSADGQQ